MWARFWGQDGPTKQRPQDEGPGASSDATVTSGSHILKEYPNDTTYQTRST